MSLVNARGDSSCKRFLLENRRADQFHVPALAFYLDCDRKDDDNDQEIGLPERNLGAP